MSLFGAAAAEFIQIDLKKQAAQCLFTSQQFTEAAKLFEEIGFYSQAGEAYYTLGDYSRAAMLYSEGGMVSKAVDCYKRLRNWDAILQCVKTHEADFTQAQREQLIKKYVPLALNSLYTLMTTDNLVDGDSDEETAELQKPKETLVKDYDIKTMKSVIKEEESEDEVLENQEGDSSEEERKSDQAESDILTNQSQLEADEPQLKASAAKPDLVKAESKAASELDSFVLIDTSKPKKAPKQASESDFSIISSQQKATLEAEEEAS